MEEMTACDGPPGYRRPEPVSMSRKKELLRFAEELADQVQQRCPEAGPERCFLNSAVRMLIDRE